MASFIPPPAGDRLLVLAGGISGGGFASTAVNYFGPSQWVGAAQSTQGRYFFVAPRAGRFIALYVNKWTAAGAAGQAFTVLKDGVDTGMAVSYANTESGEKSDETNSFAVAKGDLIEVEWDPNGGSQNPAGAWALLFEVD